MDPAGIASDPSQLGNDYDALAALKQRLMQADEPFGDKADPARTQFPGMWQLLTQRRGNSGKQKTPATLKIEGTQGGFKVTLSDSHLSLSTFATSERLLDLFLALEITIQDPKTQWKDLGYGERAKRRKSEDSKNKFDWEKEKG